jgi:hypothetical protein
MSQENKQQRKRVKIKKEDIKEDKDEKEEIKPMTKAELKEFNIKKNKFVKMLDLIQKYNIQLELRISAFNKKELTQEIEDKLKLFQTHGINLQKYLHYLLYGNG